MSTSLLAQYVASFWFRITGCLTLPCTSPWCLTLMLLLPRKAQTSRAPGRKIAWLLAAAFSECWSCLWHRLVRVSCSVHQSPCMPCPSKGAELIELHYLSRRKHLGEDEFDQFKTCGKICRPVPAQEWHQASTRLLSNQLHPCRESSRPAHWLSNAFVHMFWNKSCFKYRTKQMS